MLYDQVMDARRLYSQDVRALAGRRRFSQEQRRNLLETVLRGRKMHKQAHHVYTLDDESEETKQAKHLFIEANLPLVLYVVAKYRWQSNLDMIDLIQEGNLGLMHAIQKYSPTEGQFSTYAVNWIRRYINRAVVEQGYAIYIPEYKVDEMKRVRRLRHQLRQEMNEEPSVDVLASHAVTTADQIALLLENETSQDVMSLDQPYFSEDDAVLLADTLEDERANTEQIIIQLTLQEQVKELLAYLTPRERFVLQLRYGLYGDKGLSLPTIGKRLNVSHETVRRIEAEALAKLEPLFRERQLDVYL